MRRDADYAAGRAAATHPQMRCATSDDKKEAGKPTPRRSRWTQTYIRGEGSGNHGHSYTTWVGPSGRRRRTRKSAVAAGFVGQAIRRRAAIAAGSSWGA
eukprot:6752418-Pyramimonas_sp.AAC.1